MNINIMSVTENLLINLPESSNAFKRLKEFLFSMRMKANYQPVMIRFLLLKGGEATREEISAELKKYNPEDLGKDFRYVPVYEVLEKHNIVRKDRDRFILNVREFYSNEIKELISICDKNISQFLKSNNLQKNNDDKHHRENYAPMMREYLEQRFNINIAEISRNILQLPSLNTIVYVEVSSDRNNLFVLDTNIIDQYKNTAQNFFIALCLDIPEKTFVFSYENLKQFFDTNASLSSASRIKMTLNMSIKEYSADGYQLNIDNNVKSFKINKHLNNWRQIPDFKEREINISSTNEERVDKVIENNDYEMYNEIQTGEKTTETLQRLGQARLRKATLQQYSNQCALCDIKDKDMLIASHIIPWSKDVQIRGILENVICLCRFHDALFEKKKITIMDDYLVNFSQSYLELAKDSQSYTLLKNLTYTHLRVPTSHHPSTELLLKHRQ